MQTPIFVLCSTAVMCIPLFLNKRQKYISCMFFISASRQLVPYHSIMFVSYCRHFSFLHFFHLHAGKCFVEDNQSWGEDTAFQSANNWQQQDFLHTSSINSAGSVPCFWMIFIGWTSFLHLWNMIFLCNGQSIFNFIYLKVVVDSTWIINIFLRITKSNIFFVECSMISTVCALVRVFWWKVFMNGF